MYYMFMDSMQIPIPPSSMTTTIKNRNETINLLGTGEVNILKDAGLTEIAFTLLLPNSKYPFDQAFIYRQAPYYTDAIKRLKVEKRPFQFIVVRLKDGGQFISLTNMKVTLEEYAIKESADDGYDFMVDIKLKRYVDWGAKRLHVTKDKDGKTVGQVESARPSSKVPQSSVRCNGHLTLAQTVKKEFGNIENLHAIARLNNVVVPAALAVGQVLNLRGGKR